MIIESGALSSGDVGMGDILSIYNISIHPVVNELETTEHFEMNLLEMIEAIARVSDMF